MGITSLIRTSIEIIRRSIALAFVNIRLRNERSILGMLWYILEPLGVFFILLSIRKSIPTTIPSYALYLFLGLMIFNFFASSTTYASRAILNNRGIIHWIRVPYIVFPTAHVFEFVFMHTIELILFAMLLIWSHQSLTVLLVYPLFLLPLLLWTLGISYLLSVLTTITEDAAHMWRVFVMRLLWLGTPLFYALEPSSLLYTLNQFNPMYYFLVLARNLFVYKEPVSLSLILIVGIMSIGTFIIGSTVLLRSKQYLIEQL